MENLLINPTSKKGRIILTAVVILIIAIIAFVMYKIFIQFKDAEVKKYINEEAKRFSDPAAAAKVLRQGCYDILASTSRTNQILTISKISGLPREKELVHAALMNAVSSGLMEAPQD